MNTGFAGSERSYTWVMRRTRQPSIPETEVGDAAVALPPVLVSTFRP